MMMLEVNVCTQGPAPPKGRHRYVFLLYKQNGRLSAKNPHSRQNFTVHQFAKVRMASPFVGLRTRVLAA